MHETTSFIAIALMLTGGGCSVVSAVSLLRFDSAAPRIAVSTKLHVFASMLIVAGAVLYAESMAVGLKALCCLCLTLITAPVEAHALLRAWHKQRGHGQSHGAPQPNSGHHEHL